MKKMVWLTILIAIVAVVLVSVFVIQRNSLSTEVSRLQADNADLNKQLNEVDMAVKTAQELAETMVHDAEEKLNAVTAERDTLQADNEAKTAGIKQVQTVLNTLVGDETTQQLAETQEALTAMTAERDALQASLDEAKVQAEALETVTAERDALQNAVEQARIEKAQVTILNADGETVAELDDLNQLNLDNLSAGNYTVNISVINAAGEKAAAYAFPYAVAETAAQEELPAETPVTEENPEPEKTEDAQAQEEQPQEAETAEPAAEAPETEAPDAEAPAEETAANDAA